MRPFSLKCGVKNSISESDNLQRQYQILDHYLNNLLKKRILIESDGDCLPRAVFNRMKRKNPATTVLEL